MASSPRSIIAATPTVLPPDDRLIWVERVARLMDSQFQLPGTRFRFGLDPVLGLIPVVGDLSTLAVSAVLILTMMRHGAKGSVVVRMVLNVLIDTVIGAIPLLGNIFDFAYKANDKNVRLLRRHYVEGKYQGSGKGLIALVLGLFLLVGGLIVWGGIWVIQALWHYFQ